MLIGSFSPGSVALWNGTPVPTTYVSSSSLLATVPASNVTAVGTASITVSAPLTTVGLPISNVQTFTISPSVAAAAISPSTPTFGPVLIGGSITSTLTVSSIGQLPLTITGITFSDATRFSQTNTCTSAVAPGQSCTIQVTFKPDSSSLLGVVPGIVTLALVSNAATAPTPVRLATSVGDVRLMDPTSSHLVVAGKSITFPINFNLYGSLPKADVQFSCSGLPQGAACSFNPTSMPLSNTGTVSLTMSTTGSSNSSLNRIRHQNEALAAFMVLCLWGVRRRRPMPVDVLVFLLPVLVLGLSACSAGGSGSSTQTPNPNPTPNPNATPPGVYAVTVTGSSGSATQTTTVNVTVTSR